MQVDDGALDELVDEGRRMLTIQIQQQESVERRAAELLRLSVATLGGIVVVSGLLLTSSVRLPMGSFVGFAGGVVGASIAAFLLAKLLVGTAGEAALSYGPNLREVMASVRATGISRAGLRESIADAMPEWLEDNGRRLARQRRTKSDALLWLTGGVLSVLAALLYILGGHILG